LTESYEPMFLEDLVKSVKFAEITSHVPTSADTLQDSESMEMDDIIDQGFSMEDIKGWQKLACDTCMIIWAEPAEPVRMSMLCAKCGGTAHNEGSF